MEHGNASRAVPRRGLAVVAAAVLPLLGVAPVSAGASEAAAKPSSWNATVIAKDADRGRLVTAGRSGEVRSVLASQRAAASTRLGQRVRVRGQRLADGTYRVTRLRRTGKAKRTRLRGVVVQRTAAGYLVSAGGSVFSVSAKREHKARAASNHAVDAGDLILADVSLSSDGLVEQRLRDVGDADVVELEGLFLELGDGVLKLAVEKRGLVEVTVPAGMTIRPPAAGTEVELLASIGPDGALTLVMLDTEDEDGIDFDAEDAETEIEGTVTELTAEAVTVQGRSRTLTCAIPAGTVLTGVAIGDRVEMECVMGDAGPTLRELESATTEVEPDEHERDDEHGDDREEHSDDQDADEDEKDDDEDD